VYFRIVEIMNRTTNVPRTINTGGGTQAREGAGAHFVKNLRPPGKMCWT